jgi:hypothetical protein
MNINIRDSNEIINFDIFNSRKHVLNSNTLFHNLKELDFKNMFELIDKDTKNKLSTVEKIGILLYEDEHNYQINPHLNFLINNHDTPEDFKNIKEKFRNSTNTHNISTNNFIDMINPYGLERVVFTGGGTKGTIYMGTFIGLLSVGQIFYLDTYVGTSIGALSAMIFGCVVPDKSTFLCIKKNTLREILVENKSLILKYKKCVSLIIEKFYNRGIDTFYNEPEYSIYGLYSAFDKIMNNNGLFDFDSSGFKIWYAMLCKKICVIMENGLDNFIKIKKADGEYIQFDDIISEQIDDSEHEFRDDIYFSQENFDGWILESFFTFEQYNRFTGKTIIMTGTKTDPIETVYYTHTNDCYKDLDVIIGATASMSIPWIFKAPIIKKSYHLDGGIYNNYPLTSFDIECNSSKTHYHNKTFGFWIDDKNTFIDTYEILKELWLVYNNFINIQKMEMLNGSHNFVLISEIFFEIRNEIFKMIYIPDIEIRNFLTNGVKGFCMDDFINIIRDLKVYSQNSNSINYELINYDENEIQEIFTGLLNMINTNFKKGMKTNWSHILHLTRKQKKTLHHFIENIKIDLEKTEKTIIKIGIIEEYGIMLNNLMKYIFSYFELKITNDLSKKTHKRPCYFFLKKIQVLYSKFDKIKNELDKTKINNCDSLLIHIDIGKTLCQKILLRSSSNDLDTTKINQDNKSSYQKAIDYFFHADITGILYNYMCISNNKICGDSFNKMRTINLNTFETSVLHFGMKDNLKCRLIFEGYSKTIKYFSSILKSMEITERYKREEFLETLETRYIKSITN